MTLPVFSLWKAGSLCSIISPMFGFLTFMIRDDSFKYIYNLLDRIHILITLGIYLCFYLYFHMSDSHDSIVLSSMSIMGPAADLTTILLPCCFFIGTFRSVTFSLCVLPGEVSDENVIVTYPSFNACSNFLSILISPGLDGKNLSISLLSAAADDLRSYD